MNDIDILINCAKDEVGYTESPVGSNKTKYGKSYGVNGVPWCVQFVWWCFRQSNLSPLFYGGGKTASCGLLKTYAVNHNQWITSDYKRGDCVIFDFANTGSYTDHIGIVYDTDNTFVYTIEGNTSSGETGSQDNGGCVALKRRSKTLVHGAYRPLYKGDDIMTGKEIYEELQKYTSSLSIPDDVKEEYEEAVKAGITDGYNPCQLVPRWQAALMAYRAKPKRKGKSKT